MSPSASGSRRQEEIHQRVEEVAELLQIDDLLSKRPGSSGGDQQRAALARASGTPPGRLFDG
jgi:ABC-type sugar transport system ATPase subunit